MNKYYEVEGYIDGEREVLFGSFDKRDCTYELEAERESWKAEGYKKIKIVSRETQETPDPEVYGDELYQVVICRALRDKDVTISVGDMSEDYDDIEPDVNGRLCHVASCATVSCAHRKAKELNSKYGV